MIADRLAYRAMRANRSARFFATLALRAAERGERRECNRLLKVTAVKTDGARAMLDLAAAL